METNQAKTGHRDAIFQIVSLLGSIASITGISLLWLRETGGSALSVDFVRVVVGVVLAFGFLTLGVAGVYEIYDRWTANYRVTILWKFVYFSLFTPFLTLILMAAANHFIKVAQGHVESAMTGVPYLKIVYDRHGWEFPSTPR